MHTVHGSKKHGVVTYLHDLIHMSVSESASQLIFTLLEISVIDELA